jgi:hypothetical protein
VQRDQLVDVGERKRPEEQPVGLDHPASLTPGARLYSALVE